MSRFSHEKSLGAAFAAVLHGDRSLRVGQALPAEMLAEMTSLLSELDGADSAHKMRVLRAMAENVRGELSGEGLPPRARAMLARSLPKEIGRKFLEGAPQARHDYTAAPELLASLQHFATVSTAE